MQPKLQKATPVLLSRDIAATVNFFQKLGFECRVQHDGFAMLQRDDVSLNFTKCPDQKLIDWSSCRIEVSGIDTLFKEVEQQGLAHPGKHGKPHDTDYGTREFGVIDCHGVLVTFFEQRKAP